MTETTAADSKVCCRCGSEEATTAFSKRSAAKDGLMPHCRACEAARKAKGSTPRTPKATSGPEPVVSAPRVYGKLAVSRDLGGAWQVTEDGCFLESVKSRDAGRARIAALKA